MPAKTKTRPTYRTAFRALLLIAALLAAGCSQDQRPARVTAVVGQPAPAFTLTDIKGKKWSLAELRGQVVFLNFWATWCPSCLQEMPSMEALNRQVAGKPVQMLAVLCNDRPVNAWNLVRKQGFTFPIPVDADGSVYTSYGLTGVPETYIIDPQGVLREKFIGAVNWDSPGALALLGKYLPPAAAASPLPGQADGKDR